MSGVHATQACPPEPSGDATPFLDTLYDIAATGVEPGGGVGLPEIEVFLHEHARTPKSLTEFRAFFERHGLSTRADRPDPAELRILEALPAIEPPPPALGAPVVPEADDEDERETRPGTLNAPVLASPARGSRWSAVIWLATGLVLLSVGATIAWTVLTLGQMRAELARAQMQNEDNHRAIEHLDAQATQIQGGLYDTSSAMRRVEEKNDLLLDTLLPAPVERR